MTRDVNLTAHYVWVSLFISKGVFFLTEFLPGLCHTCCQHFNSIQAITDISQQKEQRHAGHSNGFHLFFTLGFSRVIILKHQPFLRSSSNNWLLFLKGRFNLSMVFPSVSPTISILWVLHSAELMLELSSAKISSDL